MNSTSDKSKLTADEARLFLLWEEEPPKAVPLKDLLTPPPNKHEEARKRNVAEALRRWRRPSAFDAF